MGVYRDVEHKSNKNGMVSDGGAATDTVRVCAYFRSHISSKCTMAMATDRVLRAVLYLIIVLNHTTGLCAHAVAAVAVALSSSTISIVAGSDVLGALFFFTHLLINKIRWCVCAGRLLRLLGNRATTSPATFAFITIFFIYRFIRFVKLE